MKTYLLIGSAHYDGGTDADWSTPFREEISAKDDDMALSKARIIVEKKYKEARADNGFDATLYGPPIKHFYYERGEAAEPAVKAKKAVKAGFVEV